MIESIESFIVRTCADSLSRLTPEKALVSVVHNYVGLRMFSDEISNKRVAEECGYSPGGITKICKEWCRRVNDGDPEVQALIKAYARWKALPHKADGKRGEYVPMRLGFRFTASEERRMRGAVRDSIVFMASFGRGAAPRLHGEYYTPGMCPGSNEVGRKWLLRDSAMIYCGCSGSELDVATETGVVECRVYRSNCGHLFKEYALDTLMKYIGEEQHYG